MPVYIIFITPHHQDSQAEEVITDLSCESIGCSLPSAKGQYYLTAIS